jgi:hypothetical protein
MPHHVSSTRLTTCRPAEESDSDDRLFTHLLAKLGGARNETTGGHYEWLHAAQEAADKIAGSVCGIAGAEENYHHLQAPDHTRNHPFTVRSSRNAWIGGGWQDWAGWATQYVDRFQIGLGGYLPLEVPELRRVSPDSDRLGGMIATTS